MHENATKKAQICRPDLVPRGSKFEGHFREHTKIQQKRPKYAGLIYFHVHVYWEVILESAPKRNKKRQKRPKFAGLIYFHAHVYSDNCTQNFCGSFY